MYKRQVEPWGANSFRVRSTVLGELEDTDYALLPQEPVKAEIKVEEYKGVIDVYKRQASIRTEAMTEWPQNFYIIRRKISL